MKKILIFSIMILVLMSGCDAKKPKISNKVQIEMQDGSKIVLELYPQYAPRTVENFKSLVKSGFYDGTKFHRIMKGFMIQGGQGGKTNTIKGEFPSNGYPKNTLQHRKGVISMARIPDDPNSATSQFFIMHADNLYLDGDFAAFGKVIEGLDVIDKIAETPVGPTNTQNPEMSVPLKDVIINKIIILE